MNENQEAMRKLFDGIYNFVAPVPDEGQEQKSFYTQLRTGIDVSGFTKKEYAIMADVIPAVQRDYAEAGKVSEVYQKILGATVPMDSASEENQKKYEKAKELLSKNSETYADYKEARKVYQKAYRVYCRLLNDKNANLYDVEDAKMDMQNAFDDFEAAGKSEIEEALAVVSAYEKYTPFSVFTKAGQIFDQAETDERTKGYYDVDLIPNVEKGLKQLAWEEAVIHTSSQNISIGNEAKQTSFSNLDEVSSGWWLWKSKEQASSEEKQLMNSANSKMRTNDMSLSMEIAIVEISRPWFNESLLTYSGAYLQDEQPGTICGGTLLGGGAMPIVPTAFILVKNVKIYNQFSEEEKNMMNTITVGASQNLSYGPFMVSHVEKASYRDEISKEEQEKFGNVSCLNLGDVPQLIGMISTVMTPKFPSKSGERQLSSRRKLSLRENPIVSAKKMWDAMKSVLYADELAYMLNSLRINSFKEFSADWVTTLENRVEKLNTVGGDWHNVRSDIVANYLSPFMTYSNLYSSINNKLMTNKDIATEDIAAMIEGLCEKAKINAKNIRKSKLRFDEWNANVNSMLVLLNDSMNEGWKALDVEEASVVELAEKLALLQNALGEAQDEILPAYINWDVDFGKSYGEFVYSVLIAGEAVSYLSVGGLFLSVGSIFYDALSSHMDVEAYSKKLAECKKKFSLSQQTLTQTKALLQLLQTLLLKLSAMRNEFDGIIEIWDDEVSYLKGLCDAFKKGAAPEKTILVAGTAKWETNSRYAEKFLMGDAQSHQFKMEL